MFSRPGRKAWQPKLPQGTTKEVIITKSRPSSASATPRPSTPLRAPSHSKTSTSTSTITSRKRGSTDSPIPSSSAAARTRSPARKKGRTERSVSRTVSLNLMSEDDGESGEEPDVIFAPKTERKAGTTVRTDMARDLASRALKALDDACYVGTADLKFVHASDVIGLPRPDDDEPKKIGKKVAKQSVEKIFKGATDEKSKIELQYPGSLTRERFHLVSGDETLQVLDDIYKVVKNVRNFYITEEEDKQRLDEILTALMRRSGKISNTTKELKDIDAYRRAIDEYNEIVRRHLTSGKILKAIQEQHVLPAELVELIMVQLYDRIITPQVDKVKKYENGTDYIYGEMHPEFTTQVLCNDTQMTSEQVFVDLGSGVGNVVLQAALQIGCQSWGCEIMDAPATLAVAQYQEFTERCKLWGIQPGEIHLIHGDFTDTNPELLDALKRADVLVTNNARFTPDLNASLILKFLDLKQGCRIVSLTDLSAASRYNTGDIAYNTLTEATVHTWKDGWVSWKGVSDSESKIKNSYYITTRD